MFEEVIQSTQMRLKLATGLDEFGKMQYKNKNYNNVKTTATPEQLFDVATALFGLQAYSPDGLERNDSHLVFKS